MTLATTPAALPAPAQKRKPGRKPIHASAADRQRAWRARKLASGQRELRTWTTAPAPSPAPGQAA